MLGMVGIIQLALSLVGGILQNKGVITAGTDNLITQLTGLGSTLLSSVLTNKGSATAGLDNTMAALGTLSGVISVLKQNTGLSADFLAYLDQADKSVNASLAAYVEAGKGFDVSMFAPVALV
jgi:hypothetical protein